MSFWVHQRGITLPYGNFKRILIKDLPDLWFAHVLFDRCFDHSRAPRQESRN